MGNNGGDGMNSNDASKVKIQKLLLPKKRAIFGLNEFFEGATLLSIKSKESQ